MEILSKRERVHVEKYAITFAWRDMPSAGFSFDCTKDGNLLPIEHELAKENYEKCIDGTFDVVPTGITNYSYHYTQPAIGKCDCGREVQLTHYTNACECGRDYGSDGRLLAPREQWGEETGEYPSDIMRIP